jgi:hypothetical protein
MTEQTTSQNKEKKSQAMTSETIRVVAEKVYALWLRDLKIGQERQGHFARRNHYE